jgi:hypothetical protein
MTLLQLIKIEGQSSLTRSAYVVLFGILSFASVRHKLGNLLGQARPFVSSAGHVSERLSKCYLTEKPRTL